ncbi:N-acetylmuramoyl-L-alanine amidase [Bacilliculturomica massiliensis]|uniref:N-acetylmuramoyl-L-alanine amidase n=1 Tax=Bacilliculturomica massiliensis TaxID=1917867 RepID=UPI001030A054|nr:N-acetylmuramoyl-L-alanine amidase [Bacilliculturomica massiliensis]
MKGKKEMVKRIAILAAAVCFLGQFPGCALAADSTGQMDPAVVSTGEAAVGAKAAVKAATYENPHDIIIQAPELNYSTTARQISIYGACDYDYPLYLNGKQIETTEKGFFAQYVSLDVGKNTFTFTNNGRSKTVTVTRKQAGTGGGGSQTKVNIWGAGVTPKYGTVTGHNISRMASPGTDGTKLLTPLAKGTVAQLTGDAGNLYRLSDGTFVYKSNIKAAEGTLAASNISEMKFVPMTDKNCTELWLRMDQNALYSLEPVEGQNRASLILYNTKQNGTLPEITSNKILKNVTVLADGKGGSNGANTILSFNFRDGAPVNGYYAEFEDGYMKVGFKHSPVLNGRDLTGVRVHIDAGHGGTDTGSLGAPGVFGPMEKDINLSIALGIQSYLEGRGAAVLMTRTDDTAVGLSERAYQVAMEKPDLCLSVHCNSMPVTADYNNAKGMLTFYSLDHEKDAAIINEAITQNMGIGSKTPRHSNLAMTRMTGYPSVLFETSFMSNPMDYQWLIQRSTQERFGEAAGKAVETYLKRVGVMKDVTVLVNGSELEMDQPPVLKEGRVLIPFRAVFEALGAEVGWDGTSQTVSAEKDGTEVLMTIDSKTMTVKDAQGTRSVELDVPAQIANGRTLVPGRAAAEALSAAVDWLDESRTVTITLEK